MYTQARNVVLLNMTRFTTRHIQGGGGWGQHFSTLRAPKLMTHWAPRCSTSWIRPWYHILQIDRTPTEVLEKETQRLRVNDVICVNVTTTFRNRWKENVNGVHHVTFYGYGFFADIIFVILPGYTSGNSDNYYGTSLTICEGALQFIEMWH